MRRTWTRNPVSSETHLASEIDSFVTGFSTPTRTTDNRDDAEKRLLLYGYHRSDPNNEFAIRGQTHFSSLISRQPPTCTAHEDAHNTIGLGADIYPPTRIPGIRIFAFIDFYYYYGMYVWIEGEVLLKCVPLPTPPNVCTKRNQSTVSSIYLLSERRT